MKTFRETTGMHMSANESLPGSNGAVFNETEQDSYSRVLPGEDDDPLEDADNIEDDFEDDDVDDSEEDNENILDEDDLDEDDLNEKAEQEDDTDRI